MSANKTKDILSLLQSRIALRANFLSEYAPSGATDWPAVEDQKADKKAVAELVKLRRELKKQYDEHKCVIIQQTECYPDWLTFKVHRRTHTMYYLFCIK